MLISVPPVATTILVITILCSTGHQVLGFQMDLNTYLSFSFWSYLVQIRIPGTYLIKFRQVSEYICIERNYVTCMELPAYH
jgi:hypothetical protein